jgi:hypothetical protein
MRGHVEDLLFVGVMELHADRRREFNRWIRPHAE